MTDDEYEDYLESRIHKKVENTLYQKHLVHSKEAGKCTTCCGFGTADCGGMEIGCSSCGGSGKRADYEAPER